MEDDKLDQDQVIGTPDPPQVSQAKPISVYTYPKIKRRKSRGTRINLTQIREQNQQPETATQIVPYDPSVVFKRKKKSVVNDFYNNAEIKSPAMERAEEIRAGLEAEFPSFAKALVRSNVTVGFWMHLPMRFCKLYLPKNDATLFLENEHGEEFILNYIAERTALSGGWKAFCAGNNLIEGDVLIFHLIEPLRFKVYVVKGTYAVTPNGDIGDPNVHVRDDRNYSDEVEKAKEIDDEAENLDRVPEEVSKEKNPERRLVLHAGEGRVSNHIKNESKDRGSAPLQVVRSSATGHDFKDIKDIEDFSIVINGQHIDSMLPDHYRNKYYELCRSQNTFLHGNLLQSINYKMATEIIIETVKISDDIRASSLSSSHDDYAVWDKTLTGFELLGMNVGFLRSRLNRLMSIVTESDKAMETKRAEAKLEREHIRQEIKDLESKLLKLMDTKERLEGEIEASKAIAEKHLVMFQEAVNAPW